MTRGHLSTNSFIGRPALRLWLAAGTGVLLAAAAAGLASCGGSTTRPEPKGRVLHATPDGVGSDCGTAQGCLDAAADGDTVEFAAGTYRTASDTLVHGGPGGATVTVILSARSRVVLRPAPGADVRIDGGSDGGRVGLHLPRGAGPVAVRGLRFADCGTGLRAVGGRLDLLDCTFTGGGHGLVADSTDLQVGGCRFENLDQEAVLLRHCSGRIAGSEFLADNVGLFSAQSEGLSVDSTLVALAAQAGLRFEEGGSAALDGVTVIGAGALPVDSTGVVVAGNAHLTVHRTIVAFNRGPGVLCRTGGSATITCSDLFGNTGGNVSGIADPAGQDGNLSVDPLFCDRAGHDFRLGAASPLRQSACGAMGAYGTRSCLAGPVEPAGVRPAAR